MSLATTCPACGTCFRVVQDQLKVSEGWVRCGHCQDVFNAMEGLFDLEAALSRAAPPAAASQPDEATDAPASLAVEGHPGPVALPTRDAANPLPATMVDGSAAAMPAAPSIDLPRPPDATDPAHFLEGNDEAAGIQDGGDVARDGETACQGETLRDEPTFSSGSDPEVTSAAVEAAPTPVPDHEPSLDAGNLSGGSADGGVDADADAPILPANDPVATPASPADVLAGFTPGLDTPAPPLPEFVRIAQQRARWESPWMRAWLAAAVVVSALLLMGQAAFHWRDRIAAASEWGHAVLEPACATFGCVLQAPQVLDALAVENTALNRPNGAGSYELSVTLRNRTNYAVAAPHLELTLSDGQGAILSRRVLTPENFRLAPGTSIAAQGEATWTVRFAAANLRVAGYTVAAFYP